MKRYIFSGHPKEGWCVYDQKSRHTLAAEEVINLLNFLDSLSNTIPHIPRGNEFYEVRDDDGA